MEDELEIGMVTGSLVLLLEKGVGKVLCAEFWVLFYMLKITKVRNFLCKG